MTATVPAGSYEFKVRLNGAWNENYGDSAGTYDKGGNIPLPLEAAAKLRFTYDHATHAVAVAPADPPAPPGGGRPGAGRDQPAQGPTKERFYFVMADRFANGDTANDKGGLTGDRLTTGYDPTDKGFYHGGDLAGLTSKLDYIKGLGTTAIWMTPTFKNKPVQGTGADQSAGYHGYWITDFTQIDPHLGTNAELKRAHRQGAQARHQGVLRHHHQPHRRRHRLRRQRAVRLRLQGRRAVPGRGRQRLRRPRLRRRRHVPAARRRDVVPVTPDVPQRGRQDAQGPGLAERPDDVPQPRQLDVHRREREYGDFPCNGPSTTCGPSAPRSSTA